MSGLKNFRPGEDTRRPQSNDGANKPWSIRQKLRHIAAQEADPTDKAALQKIITKNGTRQPTVAEIIAAAILTRAATGNMQAAECAIEQMDGKVPQTNINADIGKLERMTAEELRNELDRTDRELAALQDSPED